MKCLIDRLLSDRSCRTGRESRDCAWVCRAAGLAERRFGTNVIERWIRNVFGVGVWGDVMRSEIDRAELLCLLGCGLHYGRRGSRYRFDGSGG